MRDDTDQRTGTRPAVRRTSPATMTALLEGDLPAARVASGAALTPYFVEHAWLWRIRLDQLGRRPEDQPWIVRAGVAEPDGVVVGHGGFHAAPDADGTVEVAYSVDPAHRRRPQISSSAADCGIRRTSVGPTG